MRLATYRGPDDPITILTRDVAVTIEGIGTLANRCRFDGDR